MAGDFKNLIRRAGLAVVTYADPIEILVNPGARPFWFGIEWGQDALAATHRQKRKRKNRDRGVSHGRQAARSRRGTQQPV